MGRVADHEPESIGRLRSVPFVKRLRYRPGAGHDGRLEVGTPRGAFALAVEAKRVDVTRAGLGPLLAWLHHLRADRAQGLILLARHIPRHTARALIEAQLNFADDAGNIHLKLGEGYNWTVVGMPAPGPVSERRPTSPAQVQLLIQFVTHPDSVNWPVRRLEAPAGIGKSRVAQARLQMTAEGLLVRTGKQCRLGPATLLADRLVSGYAQVLRPKLTLGTFRPAEKTAEAFLARLATGVPAGIRYSVSGGFAAGLLQPFYRGPEVTLFVTPPTRAVAQQLRLLPDRDGPVTILKAFGDVVFWERRQHHTLAPPWLIYAELLNSGDPRAHEAGQEFRRAFLAQA